MLILETRVTRTASGPVLLTTLALRINLRFNLHKRALLTSNHLAVRWVAYPIDLIIRALDNPSNLRLKY